MPKVIIGKFDDFGRGITHLDNKVVFVKNALPEEVVEIKVVNEKKSFGEAKVINYLSTSNRRIKSVCPYFEYCGGCNLLHLNYEDTVNFKLTKIKELLKKSKVHYNHEVDIIKNDFPLYYRNKISLKIVNSKIGYFEENTHNLIEIRECKVAKKSINEVVKNYELLNLEKANLTIRSNYNDEILIIINTDEKDYNIELEKLKNKIKLVGIVYNDKTIYGDNFFYERIDNKLFKVSYDSFFQVNNNINNKLFKLINNYININDIVLDLYCGVGTLSIVAKQKAKEVYGIEIVKNAVLNGVANAKLNHLDNIKFMLGDVSKIVSKIDAKFNTFIIDPPRKGLDKKTKDFILSILPEKIIYVSCDTFTLMRDLKFLEEKYNIVDYKILDMFSYSYHVENICLLKIK